MEVSESNIIKDLTCKMFGHKDRIFTSNNQLIETRECLRCRRVYKKRTPEKYLAMQMQHILPDLSYRSRNTAEQRALPVIEEASKLGITAEEVEAALKKRLDELKASSSYLLW